LLAHPVVAATFSVSAATNLGEVLSPTNPTQPPHGRCAAMQACFSPPGFATVLLETWGQERKERKLNPSPPDSGRLK
jgi:hypothetical protein